MAVEIENIYGSYKEGTSKGSNRLRWALSAAPESAKMRNSIEEDTAVPSEDARTQARFEPCSMIFEERLIV